MIECKYTHLLMHKGKKFNENLIKMIYDTENGFTADDHRFITPYRETYEELKNYGVILDQKKMFQLMNHYAETSGWVFIHDLRQPLELLLVKTRHLKKMVWRTWGSDVGIDYHGKNKAKRCLSIVFNMLFGNIVKSRCRQFKAVGIANAVDGINIENYLGKTNCFRLSYPGKRQPKIQSALQQKEPRTDGIQNVMIEHSGYPKTHIKIMKMLEQYKNDPIHLYLVMAYGYPEYIKEVQEYAHQVWGDKATVITAMKPPAEYRGFLHDMDIAIFDQKGSYALGNITKLVSEKKKLFFNKEGVIFQAFKRENVPCCSTESIPKMSFQQFIEPLRYPEKISKNIFPVSYEERVEEWHNALDYLEKEAQKSGK